MGNTPDAHLVYGFKLGDVNGWTVEGADEYGYLDLSRYEWAPKPRASRDDDGDIDDHGEERPSDQEVIEAANALLEAYEESARILVIAGAAGAGGYYLQTRHFQCDWDDDLHIAPLELASTGQMNGELNWALNRLGMKIADRHLSWILIATY